MNNRKKQTSFVNIGSSSLLVIFLILCLVTFATLSLSSAQSDYRFSKRLADRRTEYYTASNKAELILDQIDTVLSETYNSTPKTYFSSAADTLSKLTPEADGEEFSLHTDFSSKNPLVSYSIALNDKQSLSVELIILPVASSKNEFYKINKWSVVSVGDWTGDNTLKLIK